jgi:hypothetical protein
MKKLITLLTATIMAMSMTIPTSADWVVIDNPEDYLPPMYVRFDNYGFSGLYNQYYFDSNNCYYDEELDEYGIEEAVGYHIIEENGVWYMISSRIEGEPSGYFAQPTWGKAPLADVLASIPRYEYTLSDMVTVKRFFIDEDIEVSFGDAPYLDHNADGNVNSVDLSLIKYELLH